MERRNLQKSCLTSIPTEGRATNRTHVYVSERHLFSASDRNFDLRNSLTRDWTMYDFYKEKGLKLINYTKK